jgi:hypothetical protein
MSLRLPARLLSTARPLCETVPPAARVAVHDASGLRYQQENDSASDTEHHVHINAKHWRCASRATQASLVTNSVLLAIPSPKSLIACWSCVPCNDASRPATEWTILILDMALLLKRHSFNQYSREEYRNLVVRQSVCYPHSCEWRELIPRCPDPFHSQAVTLCANVNVRNVIVSSIRFTPEVSQHSVGSIDLSMAWC